MPFVYKNIQFQKHKSENWVVVRGEIYNNSSTNYNAVAFRMVIFVKGAQVINTTLTINGFGAGKQKSFEKQIEGLDHKLIEHIMRYEIHPEGAY